MSDVIRKYLILGRQLSLSSTRFEIALEEGAPGPIEVRAPVDVLWKAQELLKQSEIQISSGEDPHAIKETHTKVLKLLIPHCTSEKDRTWLYDFIK